MIFKLNFCFVNISYLYPLPKNFKLLNFDVSRPPLMWPSDSPTKIEENLLHWLVGVDGQVSVGVRPLLQGTDFEFLSSIIINHLVSRSLSYWRKTLVVYTWKQGACWGRMNQDPFHHPLMKIFLPCQQFPSSQPRGSPGRGGRIVVWYVTGAWYSFNFYN